MLMLITIQNQFRILQTSILCFPKGRSVEFILYSSMTTIGEYFQHLYYCDRAVRISQQPESCRPDQAQRSSGTVRIEPPPRSFCRSGVANAP